MVTVAVSEPVYTVVLGNHAEFPAHGLFYFWVLLWALAVPWLAVGLLDLVLGRRRGWTAALFVFVAGSALLQGMMALSVKLEVRIGERLPDLPGIVWALLVATAAAAGWWGARRIEKRLADFLLFLSPLALILTGRFLFGVPLLERPPQPGDLATTVEQDVVLVVFDELSRDILLKDGAFDGEAYPNFARLAGEAAWFERAATNHAETLTSFPTLLTGRLEPAGDVPILFQRVRVPVVAIESVVPVENWIAARLPEGHAVRFEGRMRDLAGRPFDALEYTFATLADSVAGKFVRVRATDPARLDVYMYGGFERAEGRAIAWASAEGSGMLYWHSPFPHEPYHYDREGKRVASPGELLSSYREQARYADRQLGRLIDALNSSGRYDRCILIVTSDHGLRAFNWKELEPEWPERLTSMAPCVPLLIRAPGVDPGRVQTDYQHMDLVPTILDLLDVEFNPDDFDGRSVFKPSGQPRPRTFTVGGKPYHEGPGGWKIVE